MRYAKIIDICHLSAHHPEWTYGTPEEKAIYMGTIKVKSFYPLDHFKENGFEGYGSLYFIDSKGKTNCVFGAFIEYTDNSPDWEV